MLFSRFWFLMLAVVAGLSIAAMTLARNTYEHDRADDASTLLRNDRKVIDDVLRITARTRLDDLAQVAANPPLVTLMEATSRRADDASTTIGQGITARLRELNAELGEQLRGDLLVAVDTRGVVVGRAGLNEGEVGANLGGLPLVERAISGYVRDDLWEVNGQAYRMTARPVISQGRYYVGAILHGLAIHQRFVDQVAQLVPGATVVFFGHEGVYASVTPPTEGGRAPPSAAILADQVRAVLERTDWRTRGYTDPIPVADGTGVAVYGALPGMVGRAGGGFAVGRPRPVMPADFLLHASKPDLARIPWVLVGVFVLFATALGFAFVYVEYDTKKRRLRAAFAELARGGNHLDPLLLGGFAREIAVAANEALDEVIKRELDRGAGRRRHVTELDALLASAPTPTPSMPRIPDFPGGSTATGTAPAPGTPPPVPPGVLRAPGPPPPPPAAALRAPPADDDEQPTSVAPIPSHVKGLVPAAFAPAAGGAGEDDEQRHWREVFEQFVAKKRECGEATDTLAFEKFSATLNRHKEQLVARTRCRAVRFQVYVKDGKATLKATPVK